MQTCIHSCFAEVDFYSPPSKLFLNRAPFLAFFDAFLFKNEIFKFCFYTLPSTLNTDSVAREQLSYEPINNSREPKKYILSYTKNKSPRRTAAQLHCNREVCSHFIAEVKQFKIQNSVSSYITI